MTVEQYLASERDADARHEHVNGETFAMAGGTPRHSAVCANVIIALGTALRGGPCRAYDSNLRVHVPETGLYTYPDASVLCGEAKVLGGDRLTVTNPKVLVEVLSDGTESYDRGARFRHYQALTSLEDILLVGSDEKRVQHFRRLPTSQWLLTTYEGLSAGEQIELESVSARFAFDDVYAQLEGVPTS